MRIQSMVKVNYFRKPFVSWQRWDQSSSSLPVYINFSLISLGAPENTFIQM